MPKNADPMSALRAALRTAIHDTLYHSIAIPDGRWYWQTDAGTPNDLADAVMERLPAPSPEGARHPEAGETE